MQEPFKRLKNIWNPSNSEVIDCQQFGNKIFRSFIQEVLNTQWIHSGIRYWIIPFIYILGESQVPALAASHEFHETCNSLTFYFMEKRLQTMLWHHNARVNSHQRWKQTRFRVCFHLWSELTSTMNVTEWQVSWNSWAVIGRDRLKEGEQGSTLGN